MAWKTLDDIDLAGRTVLTRVDINVPVENGKVADLFVIEGDPLFDLDVLRLLRGQVAELRRFLEKPRLQIGEKIRRSRFRERRLDIV